MVEMGFAKDLVVEGLRQTDNNQEQTLQVTLPSPLSLSLSLCL
jgi:hypothetical protein